MELSARTRVLEEPALLYLVLQHLSQQELLRVQRVCQTWRSLISADSRLQATMWLHPGIPIDRVDVATTEINPLLHRVFQHVFDQRCFWDDFATASAGLSNISPFMDMWLAEFTGNKRIREIMTYPNASWRKMIPCFPAPDRFLVHVAGDERGKLLSLNFSNLNTPDMRPSHPPWLTFGLLYDIAECAWHQATPWRLRHIEFDFPSAALPLRSREHFVPAKAVISDKLRAAAKSRAGLVRLHLQPDTRSEAERRQVHDAAVAETDRGCREAANEPGACCAYDPLACDVHIFTDEFHFADALSLDEIEWDEIHEYDMPREEMHETPQPVRPRRRFLGSGLRTHKMKLRSAV
ncbi:hypothetical protein BDY17DRAFT_289675 [Neohortaea acidophila]|uniref:F-box domain-containing protein n=1 Tax=Neohortaea acidophila TaxID=245834 RepID=A0A6A6Q6S9_9PEZI|nr:uncharacterized protein BDY17DRAFT_289675 [Neohortaea acidophila]KAF2487781.1 hypothetical protein BDY17DRAFT_289675 [Neohortaea acidophila]